MAEDSSHHRRLVTMKEHLAGQKAAAAEIQDLAAAHLLRTQQPIRDEPIPTDTTTQEVAK